MDNNAVSKKQCKRDLKTLIYSLSFANNIRKQEQQYVSNIVKSKLKITKTDIHSGNKSVKKALKTITKSVNNNFDKIVKRDKDCVLDIINNTFNNNIEKEKKKSLNEFIKSGRNPYLTLSRSGFANLGGFKSKSTGFKMINELKSLSLIKNDKQINFSFNDNGALYEDLLENKYLNKLGFIYYSQKDNSTKIRLTNELTLVDNENLMNKFTNEKSYKIQREIKKHEVAVKLTKEQLEEEMLNASDDNILNCWLRLINY